MNFLDGEIRAFGVTMPLPAKLVVGCWGFLWGLRFLENCLLISDFKSIVKFGGFLGSSFGDWYCW